MDIISLMRRENRAFRYAFRELQRTGWYHEPWTFVGCDLPLQIAEEGNFLITDGPCSSHHDCYCLFVIEVSTGRYEKSEEVGISFDEDANTFQINEDCLDGPHNPKFDSICALVEYYQTHAIIEVDQETDRDSWDEEEYDLFENSVITGPWGDDGPNSDQMDEVVALMDEVVQESRLHESYRTICLNEPIEKK